MRILKVFRGLLTINKKYGSNNSQYNLRADEVKNELQNMTTYNNFEQLF